MQLKYEMLTSRPLKAVALSVILMALGTSASFAAITVSQTSAFPGTTAAGTFETPTNPSAMEIRDNRLGTQTFQVSTGFTIDKFYIGIDTSGGFNPAQTISVSIFTVADVNAGAPNDVPTGTNLLTTTAEVVSLGTAGSGSVLEFDLTDADEIFLAANTGTEGYAIQLNNTSATSAFRWRLNASGDGTGGGTVGPDQYTSGQAYGSVLGTGFTHGNSDYTLAFTAIPEPSVGLLGVFAASVLLLRRRTA
ncbi:MAG: hypothetical protein R3242_00570 [Akkermansiaceae bacterium]|nr:hypothetical protein [Akkermansiaceae bacterium]